MVWDALLGLLENWQYAGATEVVDTKVGERTGARYKNTMQRGGEGKGEAVEVVVYQDAGFVRGEM
jgi:hypothetical protein